MRTPAVGIRRGDVLVLERSEGERWWFSGIRSGETLGGQGGVALLLLLTELHAVIF